MARVDESPAVCAAQAGPVCTTQNLCAAVVRAATDYAIIGTDTTGLITVFNIGAERLLGYRAAEVVGHATPLLFHDPDEVAERAVMLHVPAGFEVFVAATRRQPSEHREWTYVRRDGTRRPVSLTVTPMRGLDGRVTGYLGIARDITTRKRSEEERNRLLERERAARAAAELAAQRTARIQRLTESLSEALTPSQVAAILLDQGLGALGASAGFVALVDERERKLQVVPLASYPEARTQEWRHLHLDGPDPAAATVRTRKPVFIETREALLELFPLVASRGPLSAMHAVPGTPGEVEAYPTHASHPHQPHPVSGSAMRQPPHQAWAAVPLLVNSRAVGVIGLSFDAPRRFDAGDREFILGIARQCAQALERTRLHEAEQRARAESERLKDEFFANVSHDLRAPVAAIKASIGVVLANEPDGMVPALHRMLEHIDQAADRMTTMVNDLLELTRLQAGRVQLEAHRIDLRQLVRRAAAGIEPLAQLRGQCVLISVPGRSVPAMVDAPRLERAVMNLLSNAQKYGRPGGEIRLTLEGRATEAILSVADDGPGIPEGEQQRIFQRFYRCDPSGAAPGSQPTAGSGLGLAIARAMVELHRGRIWVESESGQGATFRIAVPLAAAAPVCLTPKAPAARAAAKRGVPA